MFPTYDVEMFTWNRVNGCAELTDLHWTNVIPSKMTVKSEKTGTRKQFAFDRLLLDGDKEVNGYVFVCDDMTITVYND